VNIQLLRRDELRSLPRDLLLTRYILSLRSFTTSVTSCFGRRVTVTSFSYPLVIVFRFNLIDFVCSKSTSWKSLSIYFLMTMYSELFCEQLVSRTSHNESRHRTYLVPFPWKLVVIQGVGQEVLPVDFYECRPCQVNRPFAVAGSLLTFSLHEFFDAGVGVAWR
jgi:hypothetical protein